MRGQTRGTVVLLAALTVGGCGYALVGRLSSIPEDIQQIYVNPFDNETSRPQVEQLLTRAVSDELVMRRRFVIVPAKSDADAELIGTVNSFTVRPITFDAEGRSTEYEIVIGAAVSFQRVLEEGADEDAEPEIIWRSDHFVFRQNYEAEIDQTAFFDQEDIAIQEISTVFAESLVSSLLEGF